MNATIKSINSELNRIASIVGGKAWGADKLKPRVYMPSRKDCKVFFDFPDAVYPDGRDPDAPIDGVVCCIGGAALKVFIDECGQHPNWYRGQKAKIMESMLTASLAVAAITNGDDDDLAVAIIENDLGNHPAADQAWSDLANGRVAEARAALGL